MSEKFVPSIKERSDVSGSVRKTEMLHASQIDRIRILNEILKNGKQGTIVTQEGKNDLWIRKETQKGILKGVDAMKEGEKIKIIGAEYKKDAADGQEKLYYFCEVDNSSTVNGGKNGTDKGWIYAGYVQIDIPTPETGTSTTPTPTPETGTSTTPTPTPETGTSTTPTPTPETGTSTTPTPTPETGTSTTPPENNTTIPPVPDSQENNYLGNPDIHTTEIGNQRFWLIGPDGKPLAKTTVETKYGEFIKQQNEKLIKKLQDPTCLQAKMLLEAYNIWGGKARTMQLKGLTIKVTDSWADTLNTTLQDPNGSIDDVQKKSQGLLNTMMTIEQGGNEVVDDEELAEIKQILAGYTQESQTNDIRRKVFEKLREGALGNDGDSERVKEALIGEIMKNPPQKPEFEWLQSNINTPETNNILEAGNKEELKKTLEKMGFGGAKDIVDEIIQKLDEISKQRDTIQLAIREQLQAQDPSFDIKNPEHKRLLSDATDAALINAKRSFIQSSWMEFMLDTRSNFRNDPNINLFGDVIGESQGWDFDVADKNWKTIQDIAIQVGITAALVAIPMAGGIAAASMAARGGAMIARTGWAVRAASAGGRVANIAGKGALIAGEGAAFHAGFGLIGELQGALTGKEYSLVQKGYWEAKEWIKSIAILGVMKGMGKGMEAASKIKTAGKAGVSSELATTNMGKTGLLDKFGKITQAGKDAIKSALVSTGNIASKAPLISQSLAMVGTENIYETVFGDKDLSTMTVEEFLEEFAQALVMGAMAKHLGARIEKIGPKPPKGPEPVKPNPEPVKQNKTEGPLDPLSPLRTQLEGLHQRNMTAKNELQKMNQKLYREPSLQDLKTRKINLEKSGNEPGYDLATINKAIELRQTILNTNISINGIEAQIKNLTTSPQKKPEILTRDEISPKGSPDFHLKRLLGEGWEGRLKPGTRIETVNESGAKYLLEFTGEKTPSGFPILKVISKNTIPETQGTIFTTMNEIGQLRQPGISWTSPIREMRIVREGGAGISPQVSQEMYNTLGFFSSKKGPNFSHITNPPEYIQLSRGVEIAIKKNQITVRRLGSEENISPKQLGEKLTPQEWKSLNEYLQNLNKYPNEKNLTLLENGQIKVEYLDGNTITGQRLSNGNISGTRVLENGTVAKGTFNTEGKQISGTIEKKGPEGSELRYDIHDIKHPLYYKTADGVTYVQKNERGTNGTILYDRSGGVLPKASIEISKDASIFRFDQQTERL